MFLASVVVAHGFGDVLVGLEWAGFAGALAISNLRRIRFHARTSDVYACNKTMPPPSKKKKRRRRKGSELKEVHRLWYLVSLTTWTHNATPPF